MLTLVTATLNAAQFLERALASVALQQTPIQHLVIDGGSTDATVEICHRFRSVDITIAPGCSLYEAWNLGLDRAKGAAVMFLNADDELGAGAAAGVEAAFAAHPDADIVAGRAAFVPAEDPEASPRLLVAAPNGELEVGQLTLGVPAINAMAFRRSLFDHYGGFDTCYRVAGDRAFLLRLALSPVPPNMAAIDDVLYRYHAHTGSLTLHPSLEQRLRIARDHIALARTLLAGETSFSAAPWLRHMRRRETAVATLRCLAAGKPVLAWEFIQGLFSSR